MTSQSPEPGAEQWSSWTWSLSTRSSSLDSSSPQQWRKSPKPTSSDVPALVLSIMQKKSSGRLVDFTQIIFHSCHFCNYWKIFLAEHQNALDASRAELAVHVATVTASRQDVSRYAVTCSLNAQRGRRKHVEIDWEETARRLEHDIRRGGDALDAWRTALGRILRRGWIEVKEEELERAAQFGFRNRHLSGCDSGSFRRRGRVRTGRCNGRSKRASSHHRKSARGSPSAPYLASVVVDTEKRPFEPSSHAQEEIALVSEASGFHIWDEPPRVANRSAQSRVLAKPKSGRELQSAVLLSSCCALASSGAAVGVADFRPALRLWRARLFQGGSGPASGYTRPPCSA